MLLGSLCKYLYFNVYSINLKENKRNVEIQHTSYLCCLYDCQTIKLSDYRPVRQAIGSLFIYMASSLMVDDI